MKLVSGNQSGVNKSIPFFPDILGLEKKDLSRSLEVLIRIYGQVYGQDLDQILN